MKHSTYIKLQTSRYCNHAIYLKIFIWLLGLSVLLYLSIADSLNLLDDYSKRNDATQISVASGGVRPRPEGITECIPYYSGALNKIVEKLKLNESIDSHYCLECEAMRNHSWDVWSRPDFEDPNLLPTLIVVELIKEASFDVLELNRSNFNWNQPILDAVWRYLSCSSYRDYEHLGARQISIQHRWRIQCAGMNASRIGQVSRDTIDRFVNASIRAFAMYTRISITYSDESPEYQSLSDRSPWRFGLDFLCMPLITNTSIESIDYRAIAGDSELPPWRRYPRSASFRIYPDDNILYANAFAFERVYLTDYATLSSITVESISFSYTIDSTVRETRPGIECNRDSRSSFGHCMAEKQVEDISAQCGCVPFVYRHLLTNDHDQSIPYCDTVRYRNCTDHLQSIYDNYTEICTSRCEYFFYTWKYFSTTKNDPESFRFEAELQHLERAPFVEFSMTVKSTPTQFISQIGGIVNLYLGFSGVSICGFVILCIDLLLECWKVRRLGMSEKASAVSKEGCSADGIDRQPSPCCLVEIAQLKAEILEMKKNMRYPMEEKIGK